MNTLIYFQYICYYLTGTSKYRVHSPFIFQLLTNVIQTKKKFYFNRNKKTSALIFRLLSHFKPKSIVEIGSHDLSEKSIIYHHDFQNIKEDLMDFIYIQKATMKTLNMALTCVHNDSVLFLNNIHETKEHWRYIQRHPKVNVTINLFYIGLIFLREQQEEQHFTIRF